MKNTIAIVTLLLTAISCIEPIDPVRPVTPSTPSDTTSTRDTSVITEWPEGKYGKTYIYNRNKIPEITVSVSVKQWNTLLSGYDNNKSISPYIKCDIIFDNGEIRDTIYTSGLRLRGNSSGKRPEGEKGDMHEFNSRSWDLSNYEIAFNHFNQERTLRKVKGVYLKSCVNDPSYSRERFCYDLMRSNNIWTVGRNIYCMLKIHVTGDKEPVYLGVYQMIEPINQDYIIERAEKFMGANGFLWECSIGNADLNSKPVSIGIDNGFASNQYQYKLHTNKQAINTATTQLTDFISNFQKLNKQAFHDWVEEVFDVELLLKTYAVNVITGMCDDYSYNSNNFYLFFNNPAPDSYKVFFIPYNYDISLGSNQNIFNLDTGIQSPFKWGKNSNPLFLKIISYDDFREIYIKELQHLLSAENLWDPDYCRSLIRDYMYQVNSIMDNAISPEAMDRQLNGINPYSLISDKNNFFEIRKATLMAEIETQRNNQ